MNVSERVALVTGGSRGIGKAIVFALAKAGAKVAFVYQSNQEAADQIVTELTSQGHEVYAIKADVSQKSEADAAIENVVSKWGRLDILVNNAGIIRDKLVLAMSPEEWHEVINTNLSSVFNFCQAAIRPMMSNRFGRIVNMSSVAADFSNPGQANYAASKAGIEGFSRCLATEYAKRGITVNCVAPGFIETDMTVAVVNAAGDKVKNSIPVKRLGKPEDIANAVLFLASEESSYITGQVLKVDGGLTLGGMG
ncbi:MULTISPECIES: 3-oxoacyl-[acyl-carrier-protein] reductase [unclassified Schlesneria]|uniref:3-oxoacyl-[acyl-carrier-protein] reductase n=1 Tax=unclassified Schlesneria TaxID=2762017 RepID=UPI002F22B0EB